ncbi:MAG TPA: septum formation initiator family protein [Rubricoccaceae bacterium]|nr:septum formation initiator family protein [Rubricoccaceae bacterium]
MHVPALLAAPKWRRRLLGLGLLVLALWVAFFDSHSIARRVDYALELRRVREENARLEAEIADLERRLDTGLDAALIEEVAREQYGMRRPGETVYRVEEAPAEAE